MAKKSQLEDKNSDEEIELEDLVFETEEPDLGDIIGDVVDIKQFQQFMTSGSNVPVLDQVEVAQQIIGLEQGVASEASHRPLQKEDDPFKYQTGNGDENGAKYMSSAVQMNTKTERFDPLQGARNINQFSEQRAFITQSSEAKFSDSLSMEKYEIPETIDIGEAGRAKPFEDVFKRENKKYDPNLPK